MISSGYHIYGLSKAFDSVPNRVVDKVVNLWYDREHFVRV